MTSTGLALPEVLAKVRRRRASEAGVERCEMCGEQIAPEHPHVADIVGRGILCCCHGCGLLFTESGAAQGRYRTVPDRWLYDPTWNLTAAEWDRFAIPVRVAFFFLNSVESRTVALYPGPGGATQSELALDAWDELVAPSALGRTLQPDVEALFVDRGSDRRSGSPEHAEGSCFLIPIDACYELIGRLRQRWVGFDGGEEARAEYDRFLARLRDRSRRVTGGSDGT